MFIILTYDVGSKRTQAVMNTCRKYLNHVQKSVFEGVITESKLNQLKRELEKKVDSEHDVIQIYRLETLKFISKEEIGMSKTYSNIL